MKSHWTMVCGKVASALGAATAAFALIACGSPAAEGQVPIGNVGLDGGPGSGTASDGAEQPTDDSATQAGGDLDGATQTGGGLDGATQTGGGLDGATQTGGDLDGGAGVDGETADGAGAVGGGARDAASDTGVAPSGDASCSVAPGAIVTTFVDPVTATPIVPPNPPGITFKDTDGNLVDAHGGGIIKVCDTYYLHGEYFLSTTTNNDFNGFSMYSSKDLSTWRNEGLILPQQPSGQLGPNRKGERPHIIKCPSTGEFVLYAHSADVTYQVDKEVIYATSPTVNGKYSFKGSLLSGSGAVAAHSDMSALTDGTNAYVVTESGWVYTLSGDCHSWVSANQYSAVNGMTGGSEAPTVFKAGGTFYWIGSSKTGWRANDNIYSTAPSMNGPWTYRGYVAAVGARTWMTQTTWVQPIAGSAGTVYLFWGDHWYGDQDTTAPGIHNYLTTFVFQPLVFSGTAISMPSYEASWKLDLGAGTWSH